MRRRARIGYRACGQQSFGSFAGSGVERVKAPCPPRAPAIGIGAEVEQHLYHRRVFGECDYRGRVEREHGLVDLRAKLRMALEEPPQRARIAATKRSVQAFEWRARCIRLFVDELLRLCLLLREVPYAEVEVRESSDRRQPVRRKSRSSSFDCCFCSRSGCAGSER